MLKSIYIQNFALAHQLTIDFQRGLNILTGETGTGKSILIGAISAVLGGRVYSEVVRTGAEKSSVEAIFDISGLFELQKLLQDKGLETPSEIILRREIPLRGNSRAFINDIPITITTLAEIGDFLVDIHSQNEHQSLLKKETHRYFLDSVGKLAPQVQSVAAHYQAERQAQAALAELENRHRSMKEKYELYQFQLNEIEKAQLQKDEDQILEQERKILTNSEKIFTLAAQFSELAESNKEFNLLNLMGQAQHILQDLAEYSTELSSMAQEFASARIVIEEAARNVEAFQNKIDFNPNRLEEIEMRLATIASLKKKYGKSLDEILKFKEHLKAELHLQENIDSELEKAGNLLQQRRQKYSQEAHQLSQARKRVAKNLEARVTAHLKEIGMPKIQFKVQFNLIEDRQGIYQIDGRKYFGDEMGADQIEFYISPNPGEDFKPLTKIASGGEISRIMLALKNILAESDRIPLLIFDEIDAGVSGQIALAVGKSIHFLATSHQVICITHLPQIASFGGSHFRVEKFVENGRTFTRVTFLEREERVKEIAGLMGGKKLSEEILQSARQLISEAEEQAAR